MATIISPFRRVHVDEYRLKFNSLVSPGSGYSFDCDAEGNLAPLTEIQAESLRIAREGVAAGTYRAPYIAHYPHSYNEEAILKCDCGREVELYDSLTNECNCGRLYNGSGQSLAPVAQWEPEDVYAVYGPRNLPEDY